MGARQSKRRRTGTDVGTRPGIRVQDKVGCRVPDRIGLGAYNIRWHEPPPQSGRRPGRKMMDGMDDVADDLNLMLRIARRLCQFCGRLFIARPQQTARMQENAVRQVQRSEEHTSEVQSL